MTSDSTPAFEIEKEALKTEIETGIQAGVDHLEAKTAKRKDADKYHNTRHLLKQYRKVAYAIQISEADMNVRMEMEHGTRLSTLEVNAELAGVDLSGSKLEGYARTVIRSKNMLQIIDNALNTVRMDPDHGELMYQVLYLTYFSKKKPANREVILAELDRQGFPMSMVTYHSYLNMAIRAIDRILWGYTARDCMETAIPPIVPAAPSKTNQRRAKPETNAITTKINTNIMAFPMSRDMMKYSPAMPKACPAAIKADEKDFKSRFSSNSH